MSYFIIPATNDNCVFLTCEGDVTVSEMTTAWHEVQEILGKKGWKRVLMDITALESSPKTEELFDLAKLFWKGFPEDGRIALVIGWDHAKFATLLEMLVRTVGIYLTAFVSEIQAEAWICEESRSSHAMQEFAHKAPPVGRALLMAAD